MKKLCLNPQSAQEVFNFAARHLLTQNRKSLSNFGHSCTYRGDGGTMCPVGTFLTDEEVGRLGNDTALHVLVRTGRLPERLHQYTELLGHLQQVHDGYHPNLWTQGLTKVAQLFNLDVSVLK